MTLNLNLDELNEGLLQTLQKRQEVESLFLTIGNVPCSDVIGCSRQPLLLIELKGLSALQA